MTGFRAAIRAAAAAFLLLAGPAAAQQPFAAAATVNGTAVTNFQVQQRARFLALLRAPDADAAGATDALIDETLQVQAARQAGIELTPEELDAGLVEFAGRANLTPDAFVAELERAGVAPETFRDFVRNGLYWRRYVQQTFGDAARPSDTEVTRQFARGTTGRVRLLLSEIALPLSPETQDEVRALAARLSRGIVGQAAFEAAARQYSRSGSAPAGGRIDWIELDALAPPIAAQVLTLEPGRVSEPVNLGSFVALFLLRDLDETGAAPPEGQEIDWAEYLIPDGRSPEALDAAARLRDRVDNCDDLYGVAQGQDPARLIRETRAASALPADLRQVLATLDPGEVSTLLTTGGNLRFVMMCGRGGGAEPAEDAFDGVGQRILSERLGSAAESYLEELRADAIVERG